MSTRPAVGWRALVGAVIGSGLGCSLVYPDEGLTGGRRDSAIEDSTLVDSRLDVADAPPSDTDAGSSGDIGPLQPFCTDASICTPGSDHCCRYTDKHDECLPLATTCPVTHASFILSDDSRCLTRRDCEGSGFTDPVCCVKRDWAEDDAGSGIEATECNSKDACRAVPHWELCDPGPYGSGAVGHDEQCDLGMVCHVEGVFVRLGDFPQRWGRCDPPDPP